MRIDIDALSVRLGGAMVVGELTLSVPAGAMLAVLGPNGSGKTTLLRAISGAVRPVAGTVVIGGRDVHTVSSREAARLRSVVPQFQNAGSGLTAEEIVGTGRYAHVAWWSREQDTDREAVWLALCRAGAEDLATREFSTLSGGERQRVLLARALAQQAGTLLLDEPTNHLDPRAQLDLLALVDTLQMTRVAVLHDLDHAFEHADLAAVMDRGRLVAFGPPDRVLTDALTTRVFGVRSVVVPHPLTGRAHLATAPAVADSSVPDG